MGAEVIVGAAGAVVGGAIGAGGALLSLRSDHRHQDLSHQLDRELEAGAHLLTAASEVLEGLDSLTTSLEAQERTIAEAQRSGRVRSITVNRPGSNEFIGEPMHELRVSLVRCRLVMNGDRLQASEQVASDVLVYVDAIHSDPPSDEALLKDLRDRSAASQASLMALIRSER